MDDSNFGQKVRLKHCKMSEKWSFKFLSKSKAIALQKCLKIPHSDFGQKVRL